MFATGGTKSHPRTIHGTKCPWGKRPCALFLEPLSWFPQGIVHKMSFFRLCSDTTIRHTFPHTLFHAILPLTLCLSHTFSHIQTHRNIQRHMHTQKTNIAIHSLCDVHKHVLKAPQSVTVRVLKLNGGRAWQCVSLVSTLKRWRQAALSEFEACLVCMETPRLASST